MTAAQRYLKAKARCLEARRVLFAWSSSELGRLAGCVEDCIGCQNMVGCAVWRDALDADIALDLAEEDITRRA